MMLGPVLFSLALATGPGQDPAAPLQVSYRVTATLDESVRVLRGTARILIRDPGANGRIALELRTRPGTATRLLRTTAVAAPSAGKAPGWVLTWPHDAPAPDSLLAEVEISATASGYVRPQAGQPARAADRRFDFHDWLPRVIAAPAASSVVGSFLVRLDLPADQVVGATGVPLCGDPGWSAARRPPGRPVVLAESAYAAPRDPAARTLSGDACATSGPGRKTLVWYAQDVTDFALTMDPAFRYEEGDLFRRPVRALYGPGDERTWGAGFAVRRTETALAWLHEIFEGGSEPVRFSWRQTTVVQGEGGPGQVHPMLVAPDSPDRGTIVFHLARAYLAEVVAVEPIDSVWLDEGLARFLADLYAEAQGRRWIYDRLESAVLEEELDGRADAALGDAPPRGNRGRRAELLFYQLRFAAGNDVTRAILRAYWQRALLVGARESLFVAVTDSMTRSDLGRRFAAALRESAPVDYALGALHRQRLADGRWRTAVEVRRRGSGQLPLEVRVEAEADTASAMASGVRSSDTLVIETATRPRRVVLDPGRRSHDWDVLNNRKSLGSRIFPDLPASNQIDPFFSRPSARDRLVRSWAPLAWYNDAGGWTVGLRRRDDYLGRFDLNVLSMAASTGAGTQSGRREVSWRVLLRNPTWLRAPGVTERLEVGMFEGRTVAGAAVTRAGGARSAGLAFEWVDASRATYLDSTLYERAATGELTATGGIDREGAWGRAHAGLALSGGFALRHDAAAGERAREPYARVSAQAVGERVLGRLHLRGRAWGGAALAQGSVLRQRHIYFAGPDPYELLDNPFLRSRGALLLRPGLHYSAPGGAGLRGLIPGLSGKQAYAVNLEAESDLLRRDGGLMNRVAGALFGDGALGDGDLDPSGHGRLRGATDAGIGLRIDHRIGETHFQTRVDLPLWVSVPALAREQATGEHRLAWRWICSLVPSF